MIYAELVFPDNRQGFTPGVPIRKTFQTRNYLNQALENKYKGARCRILNAETPVTAVNRKPANVGMMGR